MRRRLPLLVVALAIGVAAVVPVLANGESALELRLVPVRTSARVIDLPPKGSSNGDLNITTSRLINDVPQFGRPQGAVVGTDRVTVKIHPHTKLTIDGVAKLPGGTIVFRGRLQLEIYRLTAPIVGGTGAFSGARGTLTVYASPSKTLNLYRLTLP